MQRAAELAHGLDYDLCVLTGDYRGRTYGDCKRDTPSRQGPPFGDDPSINLPRPVQLDRWFLNAFRVISASSAREQAAHIGA